MGHYTGQVEICNYLKESSVRQLSQLSAEGIDFKGYSGIALSSTTRPGLFFVGKQ